MLYFPSSSDGTAVIWKIDDTANGMLDNPPVPSSASIVAVLEHVGEDGSPIDATTVEWSVRRVFQFFP